MFYKKANLPMLKVTEYKACDTCQSTLCKCVYIF